VPSNDIAEAGVLVRQFDRLDAGDDGKPWLPCPQSGYNSWCKAFGGLWASTLLAPGHHTSRLYMEGECGLVLAPKVSLFCAYSEDGNSMDGSKMCHGLHGDIDETTGEPTCIPGCNVPGQQCADRLAANPWHVGPYVAGCSYPPTQLKEALEAHRWGAAEQNRNVWNEMVIDLRTVTANMPDVVEGFFCPPSAGGEAKVKLARTRAAFMRQYERDEAMVLLLTLDTSKPEPFSALNAAAHGVAHGAAHGEDTRRPPYDTDPAHVHGDPHDPDPLHHT